MRFLIAEAMRPLTHELATIPVAAGTQSAAWSHDGTRIAIAAQDGRITIHTLDGAAVSHTGPRDDYLQLLSFTADDRGIWDPASGSLLATRPTGSLMSIAWNRDGTRLVDVSEEGVVRIWDAHRAAEPATTLIDAIARRVPYRLVGSQLERAD
jgi:WD40 repeat protein